MMFNCVIYTHNLHINQLHPGTHHNNKHEYVLTNCNINSDSHAVINGYSSQHMCTTHESFIIYRSQYITCPDCAML